MVAAVADMNVITRTERPVPSRALKESLSDFRMAHFDAFEQGREMTAKLTPFTKMASSSKKESCSIDKIVHFSVVLVGSHRAGGRGYGMIKDLHRSVEAWTRP